MWPAMVPSYNSEGSHYGWEGSGVGCIHSRRLWVSPPSVVYAAAHGMNFTTLKVHTMAGQDLGGTVYMAEGCGYSPPSDVYVASHGVVPMILKALEKSGWGCVHYQSRYLV